MKTFGKLALAGALAMASVAAVADIRVMVDGDPIDFHGQGPVMNGDRVLVPLRGVLERMHAHVDWNPDSSTVTARREGIDVKLKVGDTDASVNGRAVTLDVPAQIINGSTMVPLRFLGEALGEHVRWDGGTQTVRIEGRRGSGFYNVPGARDRRDSGGPRRRADGSTGGR